MSKCFTDPLEARILSFIQDGSGNFGKLLLETFHYQREHNKAYGNYCANLSEPKTWQEIPAVPQTAFRHFPMRCFSESETLRTFRTSGTTGEGFGEHPFRSLRLYEAAARKGWENAGLPDLVEIALLPTPEEAPHSSLSCMAGWLAKSEAFFICNGTLQSERLHHALNLVVAPITLFGTALAFLNYFEWLESKGHRHQLPQDSRVVETGGYKGSGREIPKAELYHKFETALGVLPQEILNEYGMTELSSQFYTRGIGNPHIGPPWTRAMVIDPVSGHEVADGKEGVLKIYDLANLDSVSAVLTRDLARRCDAHFELLGRDPAALPRGCSRNADETLQRKNLK